MAKKEPSGIKKRFLRFRDSGRLKDFLVFLVFVGIASVFWLIVALNDDAQKSYDVALNINNVPDSVTFINLPPKRLHVNVRDKGANLFRYRITGVPVLNLNFNDFTEGNRFRVSHAGLSASLRHLFGSTAAVSSVMPDSLSLLFTTLPGRRVPVSLKYNVSVAPGMVLGKPLLSTNTVKVFSVSKNDTVRRVFSENVVLRNLDKTTTVEVPVLTSPGIRVEPSTVMATFVVEQLIKKESDVLVVADNIPIGRDILFFPSRVRVSYYVPMSKYNENTSGDIKVEASFNEAVLSASDKVAVRIVSKPSYMSNMELLEDSVEYTLVKGN